MTKIQYKGKHFFIKYHPVEEEAGGRKADETVYKVVCDNRFSAKRLWMNAIEQHTFFKWVPFFGGDEVIGEDGSLCCWDF